MAGAHTVLVLQEGHIGLYCAYSIWEAHFLSLKPLTTVLNQVSKQNPIKLRPVGTSVITVMGAEPRI